MARQKKLASRAIIQLLHKQGINNHDIMDFLRTSQQIPKLRLEQVLSNIIAVANCFPDIKAQAFCKIIEALTSGKLPGIGILFVKEQQAAFEKRRMHSTPHTLGILEHSLDEAEGSDSDNFAKRKEPAQATELRYEGR